MPTRTQSVRALEIIKQTPIWICEDKCRGCNATLDHACLASKSRNDYTVSVLFLKSCFFSGERCPGLKKESSALGSALIEQVEQGLLTAVAHSLKDSEDRQAIKKVVKDASESLSQGRNVFQAMTQSCRSGQFPYSGFKYLTQVEALHEIGSVAEECRNRYLAPIQTAAFSKACKPVIDVAKIEKAWGGKWAQVAPKALRCERLCQAMTCTNPKTLLPRLLEFGNERVLSLPEGSCDGAVPAQLRPFVEYHLGLLSRPGTRGSPAFQACLDAVLPGKKAVPSGPKAVELPDGPDVELIE